MSTVHNIQIGVNVDEESIIQGVEQKAIEEIQKGIFGSAVKYRWSSYEFSREFINRFFEPYMDKVFADENLRKAIVDKTAELLAEKLARSTKFRESVSKKMCDEVNER